MRCSYSVLVTWLAVVAVAVTASWAAVQQDPGRRNPANPQDPARSTDREQPKPAVDRARSQDAQTMPGADHFFVSCLKAESDNEIALAKFAQQRAQSEEVKKFAQQMIQDHTQLLEKLQGIARTDESATTAPSAATATQPTERRLGRGVIREGARIQDREGVATDRTPRAGPYASGGGVNMMQLKKELSQQCLATLTAELERKTGPEFDRCFMGQQLFAHLAMWDALKVFGKHASPDLHKTLASAQQQVEQHLQDARRILKDLEANAPRTASRPAAKEAQ